MNILKIVLPILIFMGSFGELHAQTIAKAEHAERMQWFQDAKLGIFIHWGIYSVRGISESWSFFNNYISHADYLTQLDGFTASRYQPQEWVGLIKDAGAKYAVITAKHHDGVALWNSKAEHAMTTQDAAAAKRDLLTPFVTALKASGLKTGIYFSLPDWSHPYYDVETRLRKRYNVSEDEKRWSRYVHYYQQQLTELSTAYKPDLLWFDGDWEHRSEEWRAPETLQLLRQFNPNIIVNSRLNNHGDYETPEQGVPVVKPESKSWELCYTMNDSWGYQPFDHHYKTPNMIIRTFIDCMSMGGNLLLDIGPKADGTIAEEHVAILKALGRWTKKHGEAIYETRAGVGDAYTKEKTTFSKDGKTLFVYLDAVKDQLILNNLKTKPTSIRVVGSGQKCSFKQDSDGLAVELTGTNFDPVATVVAIEFEEAPLFEKADERNKILDLQAVQRLATPKSAIAAIVEATAAGKNLFDGKLTADGKFTDTQLGNLSAGLQSWVKKHAEVLSFAEGGLADGHYAGYSALSKDRQTLYLFVDGQPTGPIAIKGLKNTIARIRIVGEGSMLNYQVYNKLYWSAVPGIVYIDVPKERLDRDMTIIAVLLDKPVDMYREKVGALEHNL